MSKTTPMNEELAALQGPSASPPPSHSLRLYTQDTAQQPRDFTSEKLDGTRGDKTWNKQESDEIKE